MHPPMTAAEVNDLRHRLTRAAPHLREEIDRLVAAAMRERRVQWVEVTHHDGTRERMPAEEYHRRTALDLAHRGLRMLSDQESRQ